MATLIAGNLGLDMSRIDISSLYYYGISIADKSHIKLTYDAGTYVDFYGSFDINASNMTVKGTISSVSDVEYSKKIYDIYNVSLDATSFMNWLYTSNNYAVKKEIFKGDDVIYGSEGSDLIEYYGGKDLISGKSGMDTLTLTTAGNYSPTASVALREGDAWRLILNNGEIVMQSVEYVKFNSSTTRTPESLAFDGSSYLAANVDVLKAVGGDVKSAAEHYVKYGASEGRSTTFDAGQYIAANSDLISAFKTDTTAALNHYLSYGYKEGRATAFNAAEYMAGNPDLLNALGKNLSQAVTHYIVSGSKEGRATTSFNGAAYLAANPDVARAGYTATTAAQHYVANGYAEGRRLSLTASESGVLAAFNG